MCNGIKEQNEKVKAWLWRYRDAKRECKRLEGEYRELVESQESAKAIEYSDMPKAHNAGTDLSDLMERRSEYLTKIIKSHKRMEMLMFEISEVFDQLPDQTARDIMSLRYLQLDGCKALAWGDISQRVGYTEEHICRLHGEALRIISEKVKLIN